MCVLKTRKKATDYERRQCDKAQVEWFMTSGEVAQAWHLATRLFADEPTFSGYQSLAQFKENEQINDEAFHLRVEQAFIDIYQPPSRYDSSNSDALMTYYMARKQWGKACQWVASHDVSASALFTLADSIVETRPNNTLNYYVRGVSAFIEQTNNDSYQQALVSLQRVEAMLASHPTELEAFYHEVNQLAQNYKRKRNMLTLLKQHYSQYV